MSVIALVNEGDSLTATVLSTTLDATHPRAAYPWSAAGLTYANVPGSSSSFSYTPFWFYFKNGNLLCINRAIGGSRVQTNHATGTGDGTTSANFPGDLSFRAATWIDQLIAPTSSPLFQTGNPNLRPVRKYILTIMIGTNPDTNDPAVHATNVATYIAARRAAGWNKIILCTILSRTDGIIGAAHSTTFDTTYAQPYNALVRAGIAGVDQVCDFASNSNIGATGAAENTTYFPDNIHPSQAGFDIMAAIYQTAVNAVVATL